MTCVKHQIPDNPFMIMVGDDFLSLAGNNNRGYALTTWDGTKFSTKEAAKSAIKIIETRTGVPIPNPQIVEVVEECRFVISRPL